MPATFTFVFVAMGQGDCCMVRCPDGKVVVVDCGSTSNKWGDPNWVIEAELLLRSAGWAGGNRNKVDALILTHSDADHCNKVGAFFGQHSWKGGVTMPSTGAVLTDPTAAGIDIEKIYLSDAYQPPPKSDGTLPPLQPFANYTEGNLSGWISGGYFNTTDVYEVTINSLDDARNQFRRWTYNDNFTRPVVPDPADAHRIADKRLTVLSGVTDATAWSVSIIAGNVQLYYDNVADGSTADNAKSLITLFQVGDRKALLCGDATFSTEEFLLDAHGPGGLLSNIDLVQMPHHGSAHASGRRFVETTNPSWVVGSVGFLEHSYRLPRYERSLRNWLRQVEQRGQQIAEHDVDYWTKKTENKTLIKHEDVMEKHNEWTKNGTDLSNVEYNPSGRFGYLGRPSLGVIAYYIYSNDALFLFRERVYSQLVLTSQKTQSFELTAAGVTYKG